MQLTDRAWKEFPVQNLFSIRGIPKKEPSDFAGNGPYPLISAKTINNGVMGFFDDYDAKGNCLVVETSCDGHCTYQKENFSGHGHLAVLRPKNFELNDAVALFLVTVMNAGCINYNYGRKCSIARLKKRTIPLPVECDTENPDWKFMKDFMRSLLKSGTKRCSFELMFQWVD